MRQRYNTAPWLHAIAYPDICFGNQTRWSGLVMCSRCYQGTSGQAAVTMPPLTPRLPVSQPAVSAGTASCAIPAHSFTILIWKQHFRYWFCCICCSDRIIEPDSWFRFDWVCCSTTCTKSLWMVMWYRFIGNIGMDVLFILTFIELVARWWLIIPFI